MNEKTMTFEELINYAQEAKEKAEKELLHNNECINFIKGIIDRLANMREVRVLQESIHRFIVNGSESIMMMETIYLEDLKKMIDRIPALYADIIDDEDDGKILVVRFSKTAEATKAIETDGSEENEQ